MIGLTFDLGIRQALPCYGWRVYFRGIRAPFDTHRDETGEHALSAWAMRHAWARVQQQMRQRAREAEWRAYLAGGGVDSVTV